MNGSRLFRAAAPRWVTPEPLNVAPALVGLPLASPQRRALAMAVDLLLVAVLSELGGLWLAFGLLVLAWQLRRHGVATDRWRRAAGWALVVVFVALAARESWTALHAPPSVQARGAAAGDDDDDAAATAAVRALTSRAGLDDAQRIALLEAALVEARQPRPLSLREELGRIVDAVGASFGWAAVYFSLLPAFFGGQTLGKRLFGLKVVELTGAPMTVMRCLRRYGGYAAGVATGGLGFAQLLWDVNRQGLQDRTAHTVVIDVRAAPRVEARSP